jgi:integrase
VEALSKDEFRRLLARAKRDDEQTWLMMLLHFWHGGRNSEIIHLTPASIRDGYIVFKRGKGSKPCRQRLVDHPNPLYSERAAVIALCGKTMTGRRLFDMSRWTYWRHVVKLALAAGIPRIKAKTTVLKHSLCTFMIENAPINKVQERAGHVSGKSTLAYTAVQGAAVDDIVVAAVRL